MYRDTITLFNRKKESGGDVWYPTVFTNVDVNTDRAKIVARYGEQSKDRAIIHIRCSVGGNVGSLTFKTPREYQTSAANSFTLQSGDDYDFIFLGAWSGSPVPDNAYINGFYDYMNSNYDGVFAVKSYALFSVIPHFEIVAG